MAYFINSNNLTLFESIYQILKEDEGNVEISQAFNSAYIILKVILVEHITAQSHEIKLESKVQDEMCEFAISKEKDSTNLLKSHFK